MASKSVAELEKVLGQTIQTLEKKLESIDVSIAGLINKGTDAVGVSAELKKDVAVFRTELDGLGRWKSELGDIRSEIAVMKSEIAELKKMKESWGNRFWAVGCLVGGAFLGALLSYASRKLP